MLHFFKLIQLAKMKKKDNTDVGESLYRHPHVYLEWEYKLVEFSEVKLGNMLEMP